jgi:hypothetical protein
LYSVEIIWNEGVDKYMTLAKSSQLVLRQFFSISDWQFIKHIYQAVIDESNVQYQEKAIAFNNNTVILSCNEEEVKMEKKEFIKLISHLFDLMIIGANDDHHGVRYEPWWQAFTEVNYRLQHKVELEIV